MTKMMIFAKKNGVHNYLVIPKTERVEEIEKLMDLREHEVFDAGSIPFDRLPEEIQNEAKETLKAFDKVFVTYENGKFQVSTCTVISDRYASDYCSCGRYFAKDIYTAEERRQNYKEVFDESSRF